MERETSKCQVTNVVPEERHMIGTTAGQFPAFFRGVKLSHVLSMRSGIAANGIGPAFLHGGTSMKKSGSESVFRYYMHDGPHTFRFELSGPLTASGARSLEQDWRTASSVANGKTLVVDLSFVTTIDPQGFDLMQAWHRDGARFVAKSAAGRALVESITGRAAPAPMEEAHGAYRPWMSLRTVGSVMGLLLLLTPAPVMAAAFPTPGASLAFGRYVASIEQNAPFSPTGEIAVEIEASLPGMDKHGHLVAIRHSGASRQGEYEVVRIEGDSTVKQQVIARYLSAQLQTEALPASSVAVTPANYNFRYIGSIRTTSEAGSSPLVYIFDIAPKQKRDGLLQGQLWIDADTGIAIRQTGLVVKKPSVFIRRIAITRDLTLSDGTPSSRTTRVEIDTRIVGRAELMITERPLSVGNETNSERGMQ